MAHFKMRKDWIYGIIFWFSVLSMWIAPIACIVAFGILHPSIIIAIILIGFSIYLLKSWFDSSFIIDEQNIHIKCGYMRKTISIATIRKIEREKTMLSGDRYAFATKGLIIYYDKFDDMYITPDDNDRFIEALLQIKSDIEIIK